MTQSSNMDAGVPTGSPSSLTLSNLLRILTISGLDFTLTMGQPTTNNDTAPSEPFPSVKPNLPTIVSSSHLAHAAFSSLPPGISGITITRTQNTTGPSVVSSADAGPVDASPDAAAVPATVPVATAVPATVPVATAVPVAIPVATAVPAAVPVATAVPATSPASTLAATVPATAHTLAANAVAAPVGSLGPSNVSDHEDEVASIRWYTVTRGRKVGVFANWDTVAPLVISVSGAVYARHSSRAQAEGAYSRALGAGNVLVMA
ncbi:hypothetical protein D9615_005661 [Tricholomella constricta]|uniref:Ribonuclease H1 N-terminal domain-containing protein n=1 Tax=Tricholomella constricta TaxID=117010 RepID=A0A8H5M3X4_9AGAR|nr:hypothetical protein D9615_005661 [Tricholomella constricta]